MNEEVVTIPTMSPEAFAHLGDGRIAYIKSIRSEDVPAMFPQAPKIAPGLRLFALHAADGTPIMVTDFARGRDGQCVEQRAADRECALRGQTQCDGPGYRCDRRDAARRRVPPRARRRVSPLLRVSG